MIMDDGDAVSSIVGPDGEVLFIWPLVCPSAVWGIAFLSVVKYNRDMETIGWKRLGEMHSYQKAAFKYALEDYPDLRQMLYGALLEGASSEKVLIQAVV